MNWKILEKIFDIKIEKLAWIAVIGLIGLLYLA
jgi:hypothetical protein